jgi:TrmH family RNA methyltransferase
MSCGAIVLVEPNMAGNIGGCIRVAANFGLRKVHLVRPGVDPGCDEVKAWACGGDALVKVESFDRIDEAVAGFRTVFATASTRGRETLIAVEPDAAAREAAKRGMGETAILFGNEARGLRREHLDLCDLVIRIPTQENFPVLNLAQSVGIVLAALNGANSDGEIDSETPASQDRVVELMQHLEESLLCIGFLDPANPPRILRKLRRFFGRAGITDNEVDILRGICRQMMWAANREVDGCVRSETEAGQQSCDTIPVSEDLDLR